MRKPVKSQLAQFLTLNVQSSECSNQILQVIDGGALLHRIKWVKKATYKDCVEQYVSYIQEVALCLEAFGTFTCVAGD